MGEIYKRYLKSMKWKAKREEILARANGRCEKCGYQPWKPGVLQVHHLSYERIGSEDLSDLIALCPRCHMELHGIKKENRVRSKSNVSKKEITQKRGEQNVKSSEQ